MSSTNDLFMLSQDTSTTGSFWTVTGEPGVSVSYVRTGVSLAATTPPAAQQPSTSTTIDTGDNRLQRAVWRNGKLWAAGGSGCTFNGDATTRSCIHIVAVDTATGSVLQETRFGAAGAYYFYPALQTDSSGNLFVVFGRSSTSVYAELRTTVQLTTDSALGASTLLRAGVADYICSWCSPVSPSRYGDFFGAAVDPSSPQNVWVAGEYAKAGTTPSCAGCSATDNWGTWIALISVPVPATASSPSSIAAGGSVTGSWTGEPTPTSTDWVGVYPSGAADQGGRILYQYTSGAASGSMNVAIPISTAGGTYEVRLFANNAYTRLAVGNSFTVIP